jgi:hypothetical protein
MTESTTSHDDFSAADDATRHANMLRRAIKRFRDNVNLSDLETIAANCRVLGRELESLAQTLNRVASDYAPEEPDGSFL